MLNFLFIAAVPSVFGLAITPFNYPAAESFIQVKDNHLVPSLSLPALEVYKSPTTSTKSVPVAQSTLVPVAQSTLVSSIASDEGPFIASDEGPFIASPSSSASSIASPSSSASSIPLTSKSALLEGDLEVEDTIEELASSTKDKHGCYTSFQQFCYESGKCYDPSQETCIHYNRKGY